MQAEARKQEAEAALEQLLKQLDSAVAAVCVLASFSCFCTPSGK